MENFLETVEFEIITPSKAKEYLKQSGGNRIVRNEAINRLAQTIIDDKFRVITSGIGFDVNGSLIDGHHRLNAIVRSNRPTRMPVFRNLCVDAKYVIDTGKSRSASNAINISGLAIATIKRKTKNYSSLLSAVSSYIMLHQQNRFHKLSDVGRYITNNEIVDFVRANETQLVRSAMDIDLIAKQKKYVVKSHLLFVYQMHKLYNSDRILDFIEILCDNKYPENPKTCPAFLLKNILINNMVQPLQRRYNAMTLMSLMVEASNLYMRGETTSHKHMTSFLQSDKKGLKKVCFVGNSTKESVEFFNAIPNRLEKVI